MSDRIAVFSMALGHLSAGSLVDDEEDTTQADALRTYWDTARKITLARFNWGFARRRRSLSKISATTGAIESFRYQWPSGCLKFLSVVRSTDEEPYVTSLRPSYGNQPIPFEVDYDLTHGKTIITMLDEAHGLFTFDQTNIELWSEEAALALSYILASLSAMSITKNPADVQRCMQLFSNSFEYASQNDANEGTYFEEQESEYERSRR